jgi:hypothetical protein
MRPAFVLVAALFVALFFVACADEGELETSEGRKSGDSGARDSRAATCETSEPQGGHLHFAPKTHREGEWVVLPLVFHDETTAELIYSPELDVAGLGATPYGSGRLSGESPSAERGDVVGRDFRIFYGEVENVLATLNGGCLPPLLAEYEGPEGKPVGFWDFPSNDEADYLAFQFGRWTVLVYDYASDGPMPGAAMTDAERALWARSFSGRETEDGFLLLEGKHPLTLQRPGSAYGPSLAFGSVEPPRSLTLYPGRCVPHQDQDEVVHGKRVQWSRGFADWCLSDSMRIHATGTGAFIDALIHHVEVRNVLLARQGGNR